MKNILVTGGTGYIGSHTVIELIKAGYNPIIVDSLINSSKEVLNRIHTITGILPLFYQFDVRNHDLLNKVFDENDIYAVIHFAGLKAVGESVKKPLEYYENNVDSTLNLLRVMIAHKVNNIIFSSSATVYGVPDRVPLTEEDPVKHATNPYGETKIVIEQILSSLGHVHPEMNIILLRYFNPIGAHESGLIGEDPTGIPNNLMPYVTQVAIGKLEKLNVYGADYPTRDGTCIRDYIHVVDLASGHVAALKKVETNPGLEIYNLGTGNGTTVFEFIAAFEQANNVKIPYSISDRRAGDVAENYADCSKAKKELHWVAQHTLIDSCRDSWNWQKKNPKGFNK